MKKEATGPAVLSIFHAPLEKQSCGRAGFSAAEHPRVLPGSQRCGTARHHPLLEQLLLGQSRHCVKSFWSRSVGLFLHWSQEAETKPEQEGNSVIPLTLPLNKYQHEMENKTETLRLSMLSQQSSSLGKSFSLFFRRY